MDAQMHVTLATPNFRMLQRNNFGETCGLPISASQQQHQVVAKRTLVHMVLHQSCRIWPCVPYGLWAN